MNLNNSLQLVWNFSSPIKLFISYFHWPKFSQSLSNSSFWYIYYLKTIFISLREEEERWKDFMEIRKKKKEKKLNQRYKTE